MWCISDIRPRQHHTECGIINIYHIADLSQPVYQRRSASAAFHLVLASLRTLRAFYDWLRVLTAECTLNFHKLRMAEYPYRMSLVMERPPFNFECPLQSTKPIRLVQWQTAHLSATRTSCYTHRYSQASGEREDCTAFLLIFRNQLRVVDGGAHSSQTTDVRFLLRCWGVFVRWW